MSLYIPECGFQEVNGVVHRGVSRVVIDSGLGLNPK